MASKEYSSQELQILRLERIQMNAAMIEMIAVRKRDIVKNDCTNQTCRIKLS